VTAWVGDIWVISILLDSFHYQFDLSLKEEKYMSCSFNSLWTLSYSAKNKMIPIHYHSLNTTWIRSSWMMQTCISEVEIRMQAMIRQCSLRWFELYTFLKHLRVREIHYFERPWYMNVICIVGCINWLIQKKSDYYE